MDDILLQEYRYRSSVAAAAQPPEFPEQWADSVYYSVEEILNYRFRDKGLLVEALTHSSSLTDAVNYQRLEFVGDAVLQLAFSHYLYLQKPPLDPGYLTLLRAANVSTEKLARVAIKHQLYKFVTRNSAALDDRVREFEYAVREEDDDALVYGGSMKAPKVLADIVESIAAAVYIDVGMNLESLWKIFRGILQPIVTVEDLKLQPQPITKLFQVCQKQGKQVSIKHWRDGMKNVASVFVDGRFVVSSSSDQKEISKLDACRRALDEMALGSKIADFGVSEGRSLSTQEPKQKLNEICCSKKWAKPCYSIEKEEGRPHEKVFVSAVEVKTQDGKLRIQGDAKSRVRDAETSAAYFMLHALRHKKLF
ncbi:Ribonuclease 3-like protein 2 [Linum grandiflorum]